MTVARLAAPRLDATHLRILRLLEEDGRTPVARIARAVGLTDNAVRYRLRQLHGMGVVRRVAIHVAADRVGRSAAAAYLLRLRPGTDPARFRGDPCASLVVPTLGAWHAVVLAMAPGAEELARYEAALRGDPGVEAVEALPAAADSELPLSPAACGGVARPA